VRVPEGVCGRWLQKPILAKTGVVTVLLLAISAMIGKTDMHI
jgi:hypothetical protein